MSAIKQNIRNHLSKWLDDTAAKVLNNNIQENVIATYIHLADRDILNKKINILKKKNEYFESKNKFKAAVNDILSKQLKISDVAKQHNIDEQELYKEYEKFNQSKSSYQYDKLTSDNGVFTFIEEFSLLQDLHFWKTNVHNGCHCCNCALEYLFYWAYTFAFTNKKKLPPTWNIYKQADEKWLYEFEMRHSEKILKFFSDICIKDASQASKSAWQSIKNISNSSTLSTYQAPGQKKFHPSEIYEIHRKFDIRQRIRNFLYFKKQYEEVIAEVLSGKNELEIITQKYGIINKEEYRILHTIIHILLDKHKYFEESDIFNNAIKVVSSGQTISNTVKMFNRQNVTQINVDSLTREYNKYMELRMIGKNYTYDRNINVKYKEDCEYDRNITFLNEFSLLECLHKEKSQLSCSCQICTLEYFFSELYNSTLEIEQESSLWDKHGKANENWKYEFQIRHSEIISTFPLDCKENIPITVLWTSASQIFSSLFDKKKSSSISSIRLQEDFDPLQISDIHIMSDVRQKIREYLNLSNRLEKAAEKVLNKKINVATIAEKYGFNKKERKILKQKIYILEDRKKYLALKDNIDKAINKILNYRKKYNTKESLLMAARKHKVTYEILEREFDKFCQLKVTYRFDQSVLKHGVFTFIEEFSLLEKLHLWKTTTQDCVCQVCALECVLKLAYIFANISKKELLTWENKLLCENWICEFQMRHSEEIAKFSNYSDCRKVKLLTSEKMSTSQLFVVENISKPNTSSIPQAEQRELNLLQTSHVTKYHENIKSYLKLRNKLEAAAVDVLSGKKDVQAAVECYELNKNILNRKLYVIEKVIKYFTLKHKFFLAISEYVNGASSLEAAANYYGINKKYLKNEIKECVYWISQGSIRIPMYNIENHHLDRPAIFTLKEEQLLWKELEVWKKISQPYCFCQLCAMEQLLNLANQYAQYKKRYSIHNNKKKIWNKIEELGIKWLINFEMRYNIISQTFLPNCLKTPLKSKNWQTIEIQKLANKSKFPKVLVSKPSKLLVSKSHSRRSGLRRKNFNESQIHTAKDMSTQTEITSKNDLPMDLTTGLSN